MEVILLQAVSTTDAKTAANEWASSLPSDTLDQVSDDIANFPWIYRRAIMHALTPDKRSRVWRRHIRGYINGHSDASPDVVLLLQDISDLATPENLSSPTPDARLQIKRLGDQLQALIGKEDAQEVLYRLGPRDGTFSSHEPTSLRLSNWVRKEFIALAAMTGVPCDCSVDWGCDAPFYSCRSGTGCEIDNEWPACGWLWNWDCDGKCKSIFVD